MLGLPEITADDLLKKMEKEKEPVVLDAIRQTVRFTKIEEGYPKRFHKTKNARECAKFSLQGEQTHIFDFYESLCCITLVLGQLEIAYDQLVELH